MLSMESVISAVEEAYSLFSMNKVKLAPVVSIEVENHHGEMDIKSGYDQSSEIIGVKLAVGYWNNPEKYGLPSGLATIVLLDGRNGIPLAIMDGGLITDLRTGAAGAVSAKYLARTNSKKVAVLGTGTQARMQILALSCIFDIGEIRIWGRNKEKVQDYIVEMKEKVKTKLIPSDTPKECVQGADIIITTTPSKSPLIEKSWIDKGSHLICIGTDMPGKQEIDPEIFSGATIVVDSLSQCRERGEIQHALQTGLITEQDIYAEMGDIILGKKPWRNSSEEITIFDSTGLSIQDVSVAKMVLKMAKDRKIGKSIQFL
ncbi:ornithine cyclodeaminase family protein [Paenactinomyces guangxiensis]|uniref:Ornithine cyclodeaminase family protein n=1 Tax=Paenactinomyces guangxiensis TaxID=1490290 RepID=A0A7W1WTK2_9BACL|nr:ornithine cyclodeaminase family protein [Paenactinomyces guangxiensis]MBH8592877.1 ornithine cyclodeaminase family protein [Paenactinomyces guangxiensis]